MRWEAAQDYGIIFHTMKKSRSKKGLKLALSSAAASLLFLCPTGGARADFVLHHWEDEFEPLHSAFLNGQFVYYSTGQNYDPNGTRFLPAGLDSYKRYEGDVLGSFGILDRISVFGRLSWGGVNLTSATSTHAGTASGLLDQSLGGTIRLYQSEPNSRRRNARIPLSLDFQVQADLPTYSNTNADDNHTPYLGDGTVDVSMGGFLTIPITQTASGYLLFTGGGAYSWRSDKYSAAIPWSLTAKYLPRATGVLANVSIFGYQSVKNDGREITVANASDLNNLSPGSGGSFITSAINPSLITLRGQVGYQMKSGSAFTAAFDQSIWGQDAPYGLAVIFGFQTHFGESAESPYDSRLPHDYNHSNKGFLNYSLDAHVLRSNDRLNLVKIDKGTSEGVAVGQIFDVFATQSDGTAGPAIARCEVVSVKSDEAALNVTEYFKEMWIEEGYLAKRLIQN
jgi:hypothetical protein